MQNIPHMHQSGFDQENRTAMNNICICKERGRFNRGLTVFNFNNCYKAVLFASKPDIIREGSQEEMIVK